jgi:hypothetical protein
MDFHIVTAQKDNQVQQSEWDNIHSILLTLVRYLWIFGDIWIAIIANAEDRVNRDGFCALS